MNQEVYHKLFEKLRGGQRAVLVEQFNGKQGERADIKKQLLWDIQDDDMAKNALTQGAPVLKQSEDTNILLEPFYPQERLIILGGGHISLPLTHFAKKTGFSITVADDRPMFANMGRFPFADTVICEAFDKVVDKLKVTGSDYLVIVTRGHRHDVVCLEQILKGVDPAYVGMIGSHRRVAAVKEMLTEKGYPPERLLQIHAPISLPIGA